MHNTKKIALSGMMMALYIVVMYLTQGFAFAQYQIRIATALYAAAYLFPYLTLPLGLANLLSNLILGGLGPADAIGGLIVGILTAGSCALLGKYKCREGFVLIPIALIPSLGASLWLSVLLGIPYGVMVLSLFIGQTICGAAGAGCIHILKRILKKEEHT